MKLPLFLLSCAFLCSFSHAMRPTPVRCQRSRPMPVLKPAAPRITNAEYEMQRLKAQRDAAELRKLRQEVANLKQQVQQQQRNSCTKISLAHLKQNCPLNQRIPAHMQLRPTAQK